jgi:hypothetical protein
MLLNECVWKEGENVAGTISLALLRMTPLSPEHCGCGIGCGPINSERLVYG